MGLDFHGAALVALARQQQMPMHTVLTLGRQESVLTADWCTHLEQAYSVKLGNLDYRREAYAEPFFQALGAERVDSLDRSAYQNAVLCRDLNEPPPDTSAEGYDLVYDGGTLEHVFHFPNAIANCMSLVKTGGHFMASLPANNWFGHGFYQFSPELFFRVLAKENGFEVVRIFLAENPTRAGRLWRVLDPAEAGVRALLDSRHPLLVLVWAKKIAAVKPFTAWPQQSDYAARWEANNEEHPTPPAALPNTALRKLRRAVGSMVPQRVWDYLAWRKHLARGLKGLIELDKLQ